MNNQQQKTFPLQPSVSLFEETILKLKERKRDIDVPLLYFFTNTTASFKSFNDKIPEDMKKFLGERYEHEIQLAEIYEKLNVEQLIEEGFDFSDYEKMVEYIEQNSEQSMMFVAQNIKRTLDTAINLTPFYVKKIQDEIDNEKGSKKQKQKNMKIIQDLNEKKDTSIMLNERIQKISFG